MSRPGPGARVLVACLLAASSVGCSAGGGDGGEAGSSTTLTVFAAASLTTAFERLGERFEATHDGVEVRLNLAGSSDLVAQVQQGAPADVVATADEASMARLAAERLVETPRPFASNTLQIAVPRGNPADVTSLQDLTLPGLNLVMCAPAVPCGAAAREVAETAGVRLEPVSEEQSVTDVLSKVRSGEADAGLVYVTDVQAAEGAVDGIGFPEAAHVVNVYPVAAVAATEQAELAGEFVDLVAGDEGRAVLADLGFGVP